MGCPQPMREQTRLLAFQGFVISVSITFGVPCLLILGSCSSTLSSGILIPHIHFFCNSPSFQGTWQLGVKCLGKLLPPLFMFPITPIDNWQITFPIKLNFDNWRVFLCYVFFNFSLRHYCSQFNLQASFHFLNKIISSTSLPFCFLLHRFFFCS